MRRTLTEATCLMLLALGLALLHHALTPSGISIFKKRLPAAGERSDTRGR